LGASWETWRTCMTTYKNTKRRILWANGSVMRKRMTADERKERRMNNL